MSDGGNASNSAAVDEVVRRVLEKLQPQLHELLSQGVKPLVENMLQNELKTELQQKRKVRFFDLAYRKTLAVRQCVLPPRVSHGFAAL